MRGWDPFFLSLHLQHKEGSGAPSSKVPILGPDDGIARTVDFLGSGKGEFLDMD